MFLVFGFFGSHQLLKQVQGLKRVFVKAKRDNLIKVRSPRTQNMICSLQTATWGLRE
jgi:hypothetical protein